MTGEGEAKRKGGSASHRRWRRWWPAAVLLRCAVSFSFVGGDILGQIIGEGVRVKVDDGAEDNPRS